MRFALRLKHLLVGLGWRLNHWGGGFGYSGHSFYGGGGTVGGPLINHRVQAVAVYVR